MKTKFEKIDLSDLENIIQYKKDGDQQNFYRLSWFELMSFRENKVVIFGIGHWTYHLMDWRGCNFYHGRLPKSPVFKNVGEAKEWLKFQIENGVYHQGMELCGHHAGGDQGCLRGCRERELETVYF